MFIKIMVVFDSSYLKTYKTTPSSSLYTVYCHKDVAILRLSVTCGGHLEFSHEKVDEKNGFFLFSHLGSIYVKKHNY